MKRDKTNIAHRIQLKKDEIARYEQAIKNYPPDRTERNGKPFLARLNAELDMLIREANDDK